MELVEQRICERRAYADRLAEGGTEFRNFMLVDRHGHRRWIESDEERCRRDRASRRRRPVTPQLQTEIAGPGREVDRSAQAVDR